MIDKNKIQLLANIPCTTIFERPMLRYLQKYFYAQDHIKIVKDKYLAFIPKRRNNGILLTIHVDRLGLVYSGGIITYSNYYGYSYYHKKYKPNLVFGNRFVGKDVRAYNPENGKIISKGKVLECKINDNGILEFIVKGIKCEQNSSPIPIAYMPLISFDNNRITGQIDNLISIYIAYCLLKSQIKYTILFTSEEEIGMSWQYISEFLEEYQYDKVIVLDTSSIEGFKELDEVDIVFRISDDLSEFGKKFIDKLVDLSIKCNINYYLKTKSPTKSRTKTITELGRLIKESQHEIEGATVQIPSIKYHTIEETTSISSICKILDLLNILDSKSKK